MLNNYIQKASHKYTLIVSNLLVVTQGIFIQRLSQYAWKANTILYIIMWQMKVSEIHAIRRP